MPPYRKSVGFDESYRPLLCARPSQTETLRASSAGGPGVGGGFALTTLSARITLFLSDCSNSGVGSGTAVSVKISTTSTFFVQLTVPELRVQLCFPSFLRLPVGQPLAQLPGRPVQLALAAAIVVPVRCWQWLLLLLLLLLQLLLRPHVAVLHLGESSLRLPLLTCDRGRCGSEVRQLSGALP